MLKVYDDFIEDPSLVERLKCACDKHHELKGKLGNDLAQFNWYCNKQHKTLHDYAERETSFLYIENYLLPRISDLIEDSVKVEWWCNRNGYVDWHIDKDEKEFEETKRYLLPLLSTVFYPYVDCKDGELLVACNDPIKEGHVGKINNFKEKITIKPVENRLVVFSPGLLHRVMPFEGSRYSFAANIWKRSTKEDWII